MGINTGKPKKEKNNPTVFHKNDIQKCISAETPFMIREAYNAIRTKLMFTGQGEVCPVYALTSAMPSDGKTINAINLSISFAQMGKRVLLIDGDMRNPTVHKYFEKTSSPGLSEILAGLTEFVQTQSTRVPGMDILTAGKIPPNPAELMSSPQMTELLRFVRQQYDYVFIDTPPTEMVTDSSVLAPAVTGIIFIVCAGRSRVPEVTDAVKTLEGVGAKIIGFVVNDIENKGRGYYKHYYRGKYYSYRYRYKYYSSADK